MNNTQNSQGYLRKRKMLLVLPLLVLPFITLAFWALGGGKASSNDKPQSTGKQGLNLQLPDARLKEDKGLNKLSYYEIAAADSAKLKERMRNDTYFKVKNIISVDENEALYDDKSTDGFNKQYPGVQKTTQNNSPYHPKGNIDPNEQKVLRKLNQLNAALENTVTSTAVKNDDRQNYSVESKPSANKEAMEGLENMLRASQQNENGGDPEMKQINGMLDKIMDIQHPERITDRVRQNSLEHKQQVFPVSAAASSVAVSLLTNGETSYADTTGTGTVAVMKNAFYSLEQNAGTGEPVENTLLAVVHETQTVVPGSIVKFRLLNDTYINGTLVAKNNFVYGSASLNGERLIIEIKNIRNNAALFPVALSVYDMDGQDGIYIPGAIARNAAKESSDKAIQSVALNSLDPTIGAQAASAGIEAARTLLSKKVKLVRVTLKAGYQVLLKNTNTK